MPKNYIKIGSLLKPVGTNGEIKVEIEDQFVEDLVLSDHFFLRINGSYVPYFIENLRETNFILIKIEEIDNPETASSFNLKDILWKNLPLFLKNGTSNRPWKISKDLLCLMKKSE